jgi:hypothetical protein
MPAIILEQLQQGSAAGEMGFRDQFARQQFLAAHVPFGSWLCKNVMARDGERMNVSLNRSYSRASS